MTAIIFKFPPKKAKPAAAPVPFGPTPEAINTVFDEALTVFELADLTDSDPNFVSDGTTIHVDTVFQLLKYCDVTMPLDFCQRISILMRWPGRCPPNSSYGRGSRILLGLLAAKNTGR